MYWITGILGLAMAVAPFLFGYTSNQPALWTSILVGLLVVGASVWEMAKNDRENWEYWVAGILGLLAVAAPFILNFSGYAVAMWTSVTVGLLIAVVAGSRLWTGKPST